MCRSNGKRLKKCQQLRNTVAIGLLIGIISEACVRDTPRPRKEVFGWLVVDT